MGISATWSTCRKKTPDIEFSNIENFENHFDTVNTIRSIISNVLNEQLLLRSDEITWKLKRYFIMSLTKLAEQSRNQLQTLDPTAVELRTTTEDT